MAESFEEACEKMMKNSEYFDRKSLTFWGCRLYDNERDARKGFG
jgi:hypothetical protein